VRDLGHRCPSCRLVIPRYRRRRCRRREGGSASSLDPPGRTAPRNSGRRRPTGRRGSATVRPDLRANLVARPAVCQGVEHVGAPAPTDDPRPGGPADGAGRRGGAEPPPRGRPSAPTWSRAPRSARVWSMSEPQHPPTPQDLPEERSPQAGAGTVVLLVADPGLPTDRAESIREEL